MAEIVFRSTKTRGFWATWSMHAQHQGGGSFVYTIVYEDLSWRWRAIPGWVYGFRLFITRNSMGNFTISPPPIGWNVFQPRSLVEVSGSAGGNLEGPGAAGDNANLSIFFDSPTETIRVLLYQKESKEVDGNFRIALRWYFPNPTDPSEDHGIASYSQSE